MTEDSEMLKQMAAQFDRFLLETGPEIIDSIFRCRLEEEVSLLVDSPEFKAECHACAQAVLAEALKQALRDPSVLERVTTKLIRAGLRYKDE